jgi:hypothetical protein
MYFLSLPSVRFAPQQLVNAPVAGENARFWPIVSLSYSYRQICSLYAVKRT